MVTVSSKGLGWDGMVMMVSWLAAVDCAGFLVATFFGAAEMDPQKTAAVTKSKIHVLEIENLFTTNTPLKNH